MLIDIATEELSHLEVIGTIVAMLNKGAKGRITEGVNSQAELYRVHHRRRATIRTSRRCCTAAAPLTQTRRCALDRGLCRHIGDPTCDLRSNIAAEARAKIVYERLINCTDDPGVQRSARISDDARDRSSAVV